MFIGRKHELAQLQRAYEQRNFQCMVVWGRRRVGKTTLINEFTRDKETIFFTGIESSYKDNLESLSKSIAVVAHHDATHAPVYASIQEALEDIFLLAKKKQIVFVIDEYPYLAKSYRPISSILQRMIDAQRNDSSLFLILCGSSMSFMEQQVLGYQSPLYGRRTGQLRIEPFSFYDVKAYYQHFSTLDLAVIYGITGGIPQYLSFMDDSLSLEENITRNFLLPSGYLYEEPNNLMKQELREPATYNAIIKAVATGSSRKAEIASKVGIDASQLSTYIDKLLELGIIERESPLGSKSNRKTIYYIKDGMFRFWYAFIPDAMLFIQRNRPDLAWKQISPQLNHFMGHVFEQLCVDYLWQKYDQLPVAFTEIGRWWGNNPKLKREEEIDIVAAQDKRALLCECKWKNELTDIDVLQTLRERSKLLPFQEMYYMLFSKSGFSQSCMAAVKEETNVFLVTYETIYRG